MQELFKKLPKVDRLLQDEVLKLHWNEENKPFFLQAIEEELSVLREQIKVGEIVFENALNYQVKMLPRRILARASKLQIPKLKMVINGTGVILHTNLGRAPLSTAHAEQLVGILSGYSNLEYDLEKGERGERNSSFSALLCKLTGAEAALAVNNNAAAVLLMLSTLCAGKEVVVSRGELVEIGGKFRVPEVVVQGGAKLVEVGTTNKTRIEDYTLAVTEETGAFFKVHTSNYQIVGFTEDAGLKELSDAALKFGLPLLVDLGSGAMLDFRNYGLSWEPSVQATLLAGADVVCFSGDKLFGGPQAGILVGKKHLIEKMRQHPLMRALRIDKFTAAALMQLCHTYMSGKSSVEQIPVLSMITEPLEQVERRAKRFRILLLDIMDCCKISVTDCVSKIGGGTMPLQEIPSKGVLVQPQPMVIKATDLEKRLRRLAVPVIGRISDKSLIFDFRTIKDADLPIMAEGFLSIFQEEKAKDKSFT